jgi:hypothetical protein
MLHDPARQAPENALTQKSLNPENFGVVDIDI